MKLADLTTEEKLKLALEELRDAGEKLNRAWPAGGNRTLRLYEDETALEAAH